MRLKVNKESIEFLHSNSLLSKNKYYKEDMFLLYDELESLKEFLSCNCGPKRFIENDATVEDIVYDSFFFAVVEYHVLNAITKE